MADKRAQGIEVASEVAGYGLAEVYWDDDPPWMYDVDHGNPVPANRQAGSRRHTAP